MTRWAISWLLASSLLLLLPYGIIANVVAYPTIDLHTHDAPDRMLLEIQLGKSSGLPVNMKEVGLRVNGEWYTVGSGGLSLLEMVVQEEGRDNLGLFYRTQVTWRSAAGPRFLTGVRVYREWPAVIFEQHFPDGSSQSTTNDQDQVISAFPVFGGSDPFFQDKAFLTFARNMGCSDGDLDCAPVGTFADDISTLGDVDGQQGGVPLVVFDASMHNTLIISPANSFMATNLYYHEETNALKWGIQGKVDEVPAGFTVETMLWLSQGGVNEAMVEWGRAMREMYQVHHPVEDDLTVNYLSYYTDNGAYYYYLTEEGKTYEETLVDVWENAKKERIPYKSLQIDSWWYLRGADGGAKLWDAKPEVFPHGLDGLQERLGGDVPLVAHNRWWSVQTDYARQNGGDYGFIIEILDDNLPSPPELPLELEQADPMAMERDRRLLRHHQHRLLNDDVSPLPYGAALPLEQRFWDHLFSKGRSWSLHTYEQDWLHNEFLTLNATLSTVHQARTWLLQMGESAARHGIFLQYCMAYPRFYLQTLEVRAVTHIRASDDYGPGTRPDQWYMGDTSLLAYALGLAPFKDVFWSTSNQPGNKYKGTEPKPNLEAAISTLSTGPVAVGDRLGYTDRELVMRSCDENGRILKPSRPATPIDATYIRRAFRKEGSGPDGVVLATHSLIGGLSWEIILGAVLTKPYSVTPHDLQHLHQPSSSTTTLRVAYRVERGEVVGGISSLQIFDDHHPLVLSPCDRSDFAMVYTAPVGPGGVILLGEVSKWVPVSPQRIRSMVMSTQATMKVKVQGAVKEPVTMLFAHITTLTTTEPVSATCLVPESGQVTFLVNAPQVPTANVGDHGEHQHLQISCQE